jgi:protoporphyrinogen oxidase
VRANIVVLGTGPAGLAFAYRYGRVVVALEKARDVAGLGRSIENEDGVFDSEGHGSHTLRIHQGLELARRLSGSCG